MIHTRQQESNQRRGKDKNDLGNSVNSSTTDQINFHSMVRLWMTEKEATTALEESTSHLDIMMGKVGHQHLKAKTNFN